MLARNEITEYLTNQIKPYLIPLVHEGAIEAENLPKYLKLVDNICDFFEEKNYNANKPIRIIYKYLTSTSEQGITYCPIQLIVEAAESYSDEVASCLFNWYYNCDYGNNDEQLKAIENYKLKESLTSPIVIGNFSDDGLENFTSFSVDIGLTFFESAVVLTQNDVTLDVGVRDNSLINILSVSRDVARAKDIKVLGQSNKKSIERDNSYQVRLSFSYILNNKNELHGWIDRNADSNNIIPFNVTYNNGVNTFNYKMNIVSYRTQSILSDVTRCELVLCLDGD